MAHLRFTDVQDRPTEFLDLTSVTLEEFQQLVPPFEAAFQAHMAIYLLYLSTEFLWWQAVVGIIGGISRNALRMHSPCTWRRRTGLPHVYNTAIRRALSPLRLCGSVTAEVHGCPRGVAPLRPSSALRDNPVARPGGSNNPIASPFHGMRCPPASPLFASWPWPRHHAILVGTH
jgi:hypothetical protein